MVRLQSAASAAGAVATAVTEKRAGERKRGELGTNFHVAGLLSCLECLGTANIAAL